MTTGTTDDGRDVTQWVRATCFSEIAEKIAATAKKGDRIYCEGTLRLDEWQSADGQARHGLSVAAWKAEKLAAIGKNREKREHTTPSAPDRDYQAPLHNNGDFSRDPNDKIPF